MGCPLQGAPSSIIYWDISITQDVPLQGGICTTLGHTGPGMSTNQCGFVLHRDTQAMGCRHFSVDLYYTGTHRSWDVHRSVWICTTLGHTGPGMSTFQCGFVLHWDTQGLRCPHFSVDLYYTGTHRPQDVHISGATVHNIQLHNTPTSAENVSVR